MTSHFWAYLFCKMSKPLVTIEIAPRKIPSLWNYCAVMYPFKILMPISSSVESDKTRFYIDKSDIKAVRDYCGTYKSFSNKCRHKSNPFKGVSYMYSATGKGYRK